MAGWSKVWVVLFTVPQFDLAALYSNPQSWGSRTHSSISAPILIYKVKSPNRPGGYLFPVSDVL